MSAIKSFALGLVSFIAYRLVFEVLALDSKIDAWASEIRTNL